MIRPAESQVYEVAGTKFHQGSRGVVLTTAYARSGQNLNVASIVATRRADGIKRFDQALYPGTVGL